MKFRNLAIWGLIAWGICSIGFRGQDLPGVFDYPGLIPNSERGVFFADPCKENGEKIQTWGYLHYYDNNDNKGPNNDNKGPTFLARNGWLVDLNIWGLYYAPDPEARRALVYPPFATDESLSIYFNRENGSKFIPVDMKALVSEVNVDGQRGGCVLRPIEIRPYDLNNENLFNFQAGKYRK